MFDPMALDFAGLHLAGQPAIIATLASWSRLGSHKAKIQSNHSYARGAGILFSKTQTLEVSGGCKCMSALGSNSCESSRVSRLLASSLFTDSVFHSSVLSVSSLL